MSVATPALAQEHEGDDERARAHFMAGTSYFEHRRFNEAAEQFYDAYRLSGRAALLLNAANAYELARELTLAAETLERYLNLLPEDDANRPKLTVRLEALRRLEAQERAAEAREAAERAELERAAKERQEAEREELLREVEREREARDRAAAMRRGRELRRSGFITLGAGAALGAGALATGLMAESRYRTLDEGCEEGRCSPALEGEANSGRKLALSSTILTGASVAALAAGAILIIVGAKRGRTPAEDETPGAMSWFVDAGPGALGLSSGVRF